MQKKMQNIQTDCRINAGNNVPFGDVLVSGDLKHLVRRRLKLAEKGYLPKEVSRLKNKNYVSLKG